MEVDIHGYETRLVRLLEEIKTPSKDSQWLKLSKNNRDALLDFYNHYSGKGTSNGRILKFLYHLKTIANVLDKDFEDANVKDIERVLATLRTLKNSRTGTAFTANTLKDFKVVLKVFYKWLRKFPAKSYPPEVDWFSCTVKQNEESIKEVLKHEDMIKFIDSITDVKYRAFYAVMYETAMRPEECLTIAWNDVQDVHRGKTIAVHGKTGARVLYSFWSAKYLIAYMNTHPNSLANKPDPNMPLWIGRTVNGRIIPMSYSTVNKYFHTTMDRNNITLKARPSLYILRRTRLTELLRTRPEAIVKLIAGHTKASNTLGKYYNALSGDDIYDAMASEAGIKVSKTIEKLKADLSECPVCNAQVSPDQNHCVKCMTPLKQEYAEQIKKVQTAYNEFASDPKNRELMMKFIDYWNKEKAKSK